MIDGAEARALPIHATSTWTSAGIPIALLLTFVGCGGSPPSPADAVFKGRHDAMGTRFLITLIGSDQRAAHDAIAAQWSRVDSLEATLSEWRPDSPISRLNQTAGQGPVAIGPDGAQCLQAALQVAEASEGAFDPTWATMWDLWTFEAGAEVPPDLEIQARVARVDWRKLDLDATTGRASLAEPGMKVGLGGIGKGYALAQIAADLRTAGFDRFLLEAGGQLYGAGAGLSGHWEAGVRDPRGAVDQTVATVPLANQSAATSGDYERYFEVDGVRYHHVLDPRTGKPARGLQSATVRHPDPTLADAWSTACFVAGAPACLRWARQHDFGVVLIDDRGAITEALQP